MIWRKTFLYAKFTDWIGERQFREYLGFTPGSTSEGKKTADRRDFYAAKKRLVDRKILLKVERDASTYWIGLNPCFYDWESRRDGWGELIPTFGNRKNGKGGYIVMEEGEVNTSPMGEVSTVPMGDVGTSPTQYN